MEYKVKPIVVKIGNSGNSTDAANQVQLAINQETASGWEFVSCGNIDTEISGSNGCFGFGGKPATSTSILVLVFKK